MKITKRILSFALALVLGAGLLVPAVANEPVDPNAPIITKQPTAPLTILTGRMLTLEVQAQLPEDKQGTLSYAWYYINNETNNEAELIGTGARIEIPTSSLGIDDPEVLGSEIFFPGGLFDFFVVVTNTYIDDEGQEQTASITSDSVIFLVVFRPIDVITVFGDIYSSLDAPLNRVALFPIIFVAFFLAILSTLNYFLHATFTLFSNYL